MKAPHINWTQPLFSAWCLTIMFLAAYGGLRGNDPNGIIAALSMLYIAWIDAYLTGEREKALPRQSYLSKPLPPI